MVAWVVYLTGMGTAAGLAGLLAERGLRHLGRPVRGVWISAMAATIGLPMVIAFGVGGSGGLAGAASRPGAAAPGVLAGSSTWSWIPAGLGSPAMDLVLLAGWLTASLVLLGNVRLSAWTLRRNERSWRSGSIGDERVLLSRGFGPGVIGAGRPRIVLPHWVVESAPSLRRLILLHEIEHMRARDTRLLLVGVAVVMLVPWCAPLWWQLHRLRRAVETDCDARVLAATGDPRGYAHALVSVAGGETGGLLPVATLAPRRGELEDRIHLITAGSRERSKRVGLGLLLAAAVVVVGLSGIPVPEPPSPNLEFELEPGSWSKTEIPREATVILSIRAVDPEEVVGPD